MKYKMIQSNSKEDEVIFGNRYSLELATFCMTQIQFRRSYLPNQEKYKHEIIMIQQ